jgi:peptidoglycan/xylan/chitin deacetylase (PgdA/CDA1 family)
MGQTSRWLRGELGIELPLMTWDTARTLARDGFQCGAHTLTHPRLAGLDESRCRAELADARSKLEGELGRTIVHLAYPYGSFDHGVRTAAVAAGYVTACSTLPGLSGADDDLLALHRVSVYGHDSLIDFASRLRSGKALRERIAEAFGGMAHHVQRRAES